METILQNFLKMSPEVPQYSKNAQHYVIAGANPLYYLDKVGIQEEQVAPLAAAVDWLQNIGGDVINGNIVDIISSTEGTYAVYFVTDQAIVYGATETLVTELGMPTGSTISGAESCRLACSGGFLLFSCATVKYIYKAQQPFSIWSQVGNDTVSITTAVHFMENFRFYCALSDGGSIIEYSGESGLFSYGELVTGGTSGATAFVVSDDGNGNLLLSASSADFSVGETITGGTSGNTATVTLFGNSTTANLIRLIYPGTGIIADGFNIGDGMGCLGMRNWNGNYLAIAVAQTKTGTIQNGFLENYLYLWNTVSATENFKMKIPGQYIDMKVIGTTLFVAVLLSSGKQGMFILRGASSSSSLGKYTLVQIAEFSLAPALINSPYSPVAAPLFDYRGNLGIHLVDYNDGINSIPDPLLVMGKEDVGNFEYIHSYGRPFQCFAVGYDGNIYATIKGTEIPDVKAQLWVYDDQNTLYQKIYYRSLWIPVKNLQRIDVYFEQPPQYTGDTINIRLESKGNNVPGNYASVNLNQITNVTPQASFSNYVPLDVQGCTGDLIRITLTTTNSNWQPIIRKIVPIQAPVVKSK